MTDARPRAGAASAYANGFTVIELMTVVFVVAISVALALPSFREIMLRSNVTAIANDVVRSFAQARSEAVKRGVFVAVVSKSGGSNWSGGWDILADSRRDGTYTDAVLSVAAVPAKYAVQTGHGSGAADRVVFTAQGDLVGASEFHVNVCRADRNAAQSRFIRVRASGEVTSQRDVAASTAPAC